MLQSPYLCEISQQRAQPQPGAGPTLLPFPQHPAFTALQSFHSTTASAQWALLCRSSNVHRFVGAGWNLPWLRMGSWGWFRERHLPRLEGHRVPAAPGAASLTQQGTEHSVGTGTAQRDSPALGMALRLRGAPPPAGKPLHSTDPPMPQDFHLISLIQSCPGVSSRRLASDLSHVKAAAQEHPPWGWALLPSPQLSFQPPAPHRKDHQIIYRRCQLQATAKREVYLRHRVDCYTRS